jgi:RNA polymerase sigma-70 factor, ECF subfamily
MKTFKLKNAEENDHSLYAIAIKAKWDNEQLVSRALAGDPVAENAIYRQHVRYLLNLATRLTRSVNDGDEVVQDTFLMAFSRLHRLDNPDALRPWLTQILISRVRKRLRVRKLRAFFGFTQFDEDVSLQLSTFHDARPDLRVEIREIDAVLQQTPPEWRTAWMLHRIEEMTIHETAQAMSRSAATVKRYVSAVDTAVQSNRRPAP